MKYTVIIALALAAGAQAQDCSQTKDTFTLYRQDPKVNNKGLRVATFDAAGANAANHNQMYCEFLRDKLMLPNQEIKYWCVPGTTRK